MAPHTDRAHRYWRSTHTHTHIHTHHRGHSQNLTDTSDLPLWSDKTLTDFTGRWIASHFRHGWAFEKHKASLVRWLTFGRNSIKFTLSCWENVSAGAQMKTSIHRETHFSLSSCCWSWPVIQMISWNMLLDPPSYPSLNTTFSLMDFLWYIHCWHVPVVSEGLLSRPCMLLIWREPCDTGNWETWTFHAMQARSLSAMETGPWTYGGRRVEFRF